MTVDASRELTELFAGEATDLLQAITQGLVELETVDDGPGAPTGGPAGPSEVLRTVLRAAHTLKGSAAALGARNVELLVHDFETCAAVLEHVIERQAAFDLSYRLLDQAEAEITAFVTGERPRAAGGGLPSHDELTRVFGKNLELRAVTAGKLMPQLGEEAPRIASDAAMEQGSFRVSAAKVERQLAHTDDLLRLRSEGRTRARETRALVRKLEHMERVARTALGSGGDSSWSSILASARELERRTELTARRIETLSEALTDDLLSLRMVPLSSLLPALERAVRDAARACGKRATLHMHGGSEEVDRDLVEVLRGALLHVVRNAVDHGIETPGERARVKKPEAGRIELRFDTSGSRLKVRISDDGRGLDLSAIHAQAGAAAAAGRSAELSKRAEHLIFEAGFSTRTTVTETSGRGVGLDVVRTSVERRGGTVSVRSEAGRGAEFVLELPSTRLTVRVVLLRSGNVVFALPAAHVDAVVRLVGNSNADLPRGTLVHRDRLLALHTLPGEGESMLRAHINLSAVIVSVGNRRAALVVDEVEGDQEVVVGPLSPWLADVRELGGAAALADGRIVGVLNGPEVLDSFEGAGAERAARLPEEAARPARRILVVDDSITTRTLEKSILEAEGYLVEVAVSGVDALDRLGRGEFDLVVSDVEMPQMNGLELVRQMRGGRHAALPVILMSSLAKDEDRARGLAAGANEYLVKSEFQQARLLATLERLL